MTTFWRNWMTAWCFGVGLFGVVLTGAAFEATDGPTRLIFDLMNGAAAFDMDASLRFSVALLGAVTLGWSLTLLAAIQAALALGEKARPTWLLVTASVVVWYVIDSALSVATGFGLNAVSNTVIVAAILLPILRTGVLQGGAASPRVAATA